MFAAMGKNKEVDKAWREANKERLKEYNKKYYENNKQKQKSYRKDWYHENVKKDTHLPCVYYLPEEHYIGITKNLKRRIKAHNHSGKITEGYEVVAYFERYVDAMYLEVMFHQRGYNGCRY